MAIAQGADEEPTSLALSDSDLDRMVERYVPMVEAECGRKFTTPPEVVLSSVRETADSLTDDLLPSIRAFYRRGSPEAVDRLARTQAGLLASSLLGKYGIHSKTVYMLPDNFRPILTVFGVDPEDGLDLFRTTLIHELVHALQDQTVDLETRVGNLRTSDAGHMFSALIEGQAVHHSERIARENDMGHVAATLRRIMTTNPLPPEARAMTAVVDRYVRGIGATTYGRGADFVAFVHEHGGVDAVWRLFDDELPTRLLFEPELSVDDDTDSPRPIAMTQDDQVVDRVSEWLGGNGWILGVSPPGQATLRSLNDRVTDAEGFDECLGNIEEGVWFEGIGRVPTLALRAVALRFASEADARRYFDLAWVGAEIERDLLSDDGVFSELLSIELGDFDAAADDVTARELVQVPKVFAPRGRIVWMLRGRAVVELSILSLRKTDTQIAELGTLLLDAVRPAR